MYDKTKVRPDYERMGLRIYTFQFGTNAFLELLRRLEELLSIHPSDQAEVQNSDAALIEGKDE